MFYLIPNPSPKGEGDNTQLFKVSKLKSIFVKSTLFEFNSSAYQSRDLFPSPSGEGLGMRSKF